MKNLYEILEVDRKASIDVIEKAYRVLAKKYHPDLQSTQEAKKIAEEKIKVINEAYEILKNEEKRKKYDLELERQEEKNIINNTNTANYRSTNYNTTNYNSRSYNTANYGNVTGHNNVKPNYEPNENTTNNNVNNYRQEVDLTEKQKRKLDKKIQRKMQDDYLKAYGDYLTKNGYRVAFRVNWRKLPYLLIMLLIIIAIGAFLWCFPVTHNYLVSIYENNIIIKKMIDLINVKFK